MANLSRQGSQKRSSFHDNFGEKNPVSVIKRQKSIRTETAESLERMQLTQNADVEHLEHEHQVPSVSPRNSKQVPSDRGMDSDSESLFFPEGNDLGKKLAREIPSSEDKVDTVMAKLQAGDQHTAMPGLWEGGPLAKGSLGLGLVEDICVCSDERPSYAEPGNRSNGLPADLGDKRRKDTGEEDDDEHCEEETDGLLRVIKAPLKLAKKVTRVLTHELCDASASLINTFTSVIPHPAHGNDSPDLDHGFPIHLPSPDPLGDPLSFGVSLRTHKHGCRIAQLQQESLAGQAGLRESDILTQVDDVCLTGKDDGNIIELFMKLKETFTLTFLREVHHGDRTELIEIKITVTITIDTEAGIEVEVTVHRAYVHYFESIGPHYILQDPDNEGSSYLNMFGNEVYMGTQVSAEAKFRLDIYVPNMFGRGQICVIRNISSDLVYNPVQNRAENRDRNNVNPDCLLIKITNDDQTYYFESMNKRGCFLTNEQGVLALDRKTSGSIFNIYTT